MVTWSTQPIMRVSRIKLLWDYRWGYRLASGLKWQFPALNDYSLLPSV